MYTRRFAFFEPLLTSFSSLKPRSLSSREMSVDIFYSRTKALAADTRLLAEHIHRTMREKEKKGRKPSDTFAVACPGKVARAIGDREE